MWCVSFLELSKVTTRLYLKYTKISISKAHDTGKNLFPTTVEIGAQVISYETIPNLKMAEWQNWYFAKFMQQLIS